MCLTKDRDPTLVAPPVSGLSQGKSGLWGRGCVSTDAPGFPRSPCVPQARGQRPHRVVARMEGSPRRPPSAWLLKMLWTPSYCPASWSPQESSGQSRVSAERSVGSEGVDAGVCRVPGAHEGRGVLSERKGPMEAVV